MENLIAKDVAIKAIMQKPAIHGCEGSWYHADDIRDAITNAPIADEEIEIIKAEAFVKGIDSERKRISDWCRPTAEWVWDKNGMDWNLGAWVCSWCHARNANLPNDEAINPMRWSGSKFCPNCGAKMKGADDDQ